MHMHCTQPGPSVCERHTLTVHIVKDGGCIIYGLPLGARCCILLCSSASSECVDLLLGLVSCQWTTVEEREQEVEKAEEEDGVSQFVLHFNPTMELLAAAFKSSEVSLGKNIIGEGEGGVNVRVRVRVG